METVGVLVRIRVGREIKRRKTSRSPFFLLFLFLFRFAFYFVFSLIFHFVVY